MNFKMYLWKVGINFNLDLSYILVYCSKFMIYDMIN